MLSLLGLAIAVGIISWIWFGTQEDPRWRYLILQDFLSPIISSTSILVHLAVATHTSIVVAMLSGLVLEVESLGGVPLMQVPAISIARYVDGGALSSFLLFVSASNIPIYHICNHTVIAIRAVMASLLAQQYQISPCIQQVEMHADSQNLLFSGKSVVGKAVKY